MACYKPIPCYPFIKGSPAKFDKGYSIEKLNTQWERKDKIPCRKCIGCKIEYINEWGKRGYLMSKTYQNNWFITLTYDDKNLPLTNEGKPTIEPKDISRFINSLKKHFNRRKHNGIKYICAREYGGRKKRPHYHLIFWNLPLTDIKKTTIKNYKKEKIVEYSPLIEKLWGKNNTKTSPNIILPANLNTIKYTVAYSLKKLKPKECIDERIEPERITFSRGIGLPFFEKEWQEIYKHDKITIADKNSTYSTTPPKYFDKQLKKIDENLIKEIKEKRKENAIQNTKNELNELKLNYTQLLGLKQRNRWNKLKEKKSPLKNRKEKENGL